MEKRLGQAIGELSFRKRWGGKSVLGRREVLGNTVMLERRLSEERSLSMPRRETKSRKKGGAVRQVPRGVSTKRGEHRVVKWLREGLASHGGFAGLGKGMKAGGVGLVKALMVERGGRSVRSRGGSSVRVKAGSSVRVKGGSSVRAKGGRLVCAKGKIKKRPIKKKVLVGGKGKLRRGKKPVTNII